ncbi:hypothetical protein RhiirC2_801889 [Rhizophagus irregularis]|uniref:Uncharacterized protein n=1 Tax=Rhizophagus irregularis TaxID=588596 RepID=A0A2N1M201_9GLOM|nr:hypothetical protein RhiirC2_801889 [Rhizophagus irregularis]
MYNPSMKDYLTRTLYSSRRVWACAFTSRIFTAGVQTTFHVEGYNNIIKRELKSNGILYNLASVIDARLESEDPDVNIIGACQKSADFSQLVALTPPPPD